MIGKQYGKYKITNLMINHSVAKGKNIFLRIGFKILGPLVIKIFGYPFNSTARSRAAKIIYYFKPSKNQKVLDFGCGIGYYSVYFNKKYDCEVVGVDIDKEDVGLANNVKKILKIHKIKFFAGKLNVKKYKSYFDKILTSEVLEHIWEDKKTLTELSSMLKKKGEMIVMVPYSSKPHEFKEQELNMSGTLGGHVRTGYNYDYMNKKIKGTNLTIKKIDYTKNKHSIMFLMRKR
jgi:2-polyprenyl-3-methyl-5-hydroxy-6-metoxy-1,4-benzoquinol methylase